MTFQALATFQTFFEHCVGDWSAERTYHYLRNQTVERSHTEFQIRPISLAQKQQVLRDNERPDRADLDQIPGYHLDFQTVSEYGDRVAQSLNFLFVPNLEVGSLLKGDYLRDRAYEETQPMVAQFRFETQSRELLMTTRYKTVVSVDSITLVNPQLRVRRILNYHRPEDDQAPLDRIALAGFGIEQKVN
ncbi:MAG: phycobiliprotein lyase [Oscillatoriales cyanobacterium]|nr:MAG: phycobiliprotein lyase [Oscillatoriales cyanobacterium]